MVGVGRPKGLPKTGGRRPGVGNKGLTKRDHSTLARAEALRREIEDSRPPPGTELSKEIMAKFAHNCAAVSMKLMPEWRDTGEPVWRFPNHHKLWTQMMELTFKFANGAAPYQSPTFRAVMVTPPPEEKPGEGARVINLTVFEGGKAVTTSRVVENEIAKDEADEDRRG